MRAVANRHRLKILLLHQHFKTPQSGGAIRSYYLAKGLLEHGHTPVVITAHNERAYARADYEGIEVHYLPVPYDNSFSYAKRISSFLRFVLKSIRLAAKIEGVDRIYAISVPLTIALVARWTSFRKKIPYFFEVGDLWPDAPIQMGFVRSALMKSILFRLERTTYQHAAAIIALSPAIKEAILKKVPNARVIMIPNMADCEFYRPTPKNVEVARQFGVEGKFVVAYIGATGLANGLDHYLEFVNSSRKAELPIHFLVCGTGALLERLKNNASKLGLQNITFTGYLDRDGVRRIMEITDAAFVCYKNLPVLETGSPNKFFDGLAAGKLIVTNFGGWIQNEIQQHQCGIRVLNSDPSDFVRKIRVFTTDADLLKEYQANARSLAEQKFDRKKLIDQWVKEIAIKS